MSAAMADWGVDVSQGFDLVKGASNSVDRGHTLRPQVNSRDRMIASNKS